MSNIPDWTAYMSKAQAAMKKSEEAMLLKDYPTGIAELEKAKAFFNMVTIWAIKHG